MNENSNLNAQEDKDNKKTSKATPWLPASAGAAKRGSWGSLFAKTGPVGRLLATKAGMIGLAIGVAAVAALGGVVMSKIQPPAAEKSGSQFASRAAAKYYTPSGARRNNQSSLSLITGNKDYRDEVSGATVAPEAAVEESASAVPEMPELPSALPQPKAKFSPSGVGGSSGSGSSSASVMSNAGGKAKKEEAKASTLPDIFNNAKTGSGMRSTGMGRAPSRAAGGNSSNRAATAAARGQSYVAPSGMESAGRLEAMKAAADAKFREGVSGVAPMTGTGAAASLGNANSSEMPEPPSNSSASSAAGGGGGGGGGGDAAACEQAAEDLRRASEILIKGLKELNRMAVESLPRFMVFAPGVYDELCNVDGKGTTNEALTNLTGSFDQMNAALDKLRDGQCGGTSEYDGWECGVLCKTQEKVLPFVAAIDDMCDPYYTYRKLELKAEVVANSGERQNLQKDFNLNQYDETKKEFKRLHRDEYFGKLEEFSGIVTEIFQTPEGQAVSTSSDTVETALNNMEDMSLTGDTCQYETQDASFDAKDTRDCAQVNNESSCEEWANGWWPQLKQNCGGFRFWTGEFWKITWANITFWDDGSDETVYRDAAKQYCMTNHGQDCTIADAPDADGHPSTATNSSTATATDTAAKPTGGNWFDRAIDWAGDAASSVGNWVVDAGGAVGNWLGDAGSAVGGFFSDAGSAIGGFFGSLF